MASDPWYEECCYCGAGPTQWHHALIYAGKQINEKFAIVPVCFSCHQLVDTNSWYKNFFKQIAIDRMTDEDMQKYNKCDWEAELEILNRIL